jgi:transcriptional regulator with XRE-family HTH domain
MGSAGKDIKAIRQAFGLSQERFAEYVGISRRQLCRFESGEAMPPRQLLLDLSRLQLKRRKP